MNQWPIHRLLNPTAHAVPAIVVPLAHRVNLVAMEAMVVTDNPVNQENVVTPLHQHHTFWTDSRNNARAKLHQANKDQQDRKAQMDQRETPVLREVTVNRETKEYADHRAKLVKEVTLVPKVQREKLANSHPNKAQLVHQEARAKLAPRAVPEQLVLQVKMAVQAVREALEMQELLALLANQADQAQMENQANKETQEAAPTVHQPVWLQAIKRQLEAFEHFQTSDFQYFSATINVFLFFMFFKSVLLEQKCSSTKYSFARDK